MKPIELIDLMNIIEYEKIRDDYRKKVIDYKKHRRISLGPNVTITFENRRTLIFQIQEMMRTERLVHDKQIQAEIDVYNSILPPDGTLSATLFIEVTEEDQIRPILNKFIGLTVGEYLWFDCRGQKVFAQFEEGREESDKISSVHYIQYNFKEKQVNNFIDSSEAVYLNIHYKDYIYKEELSGCMRQSLIKDLA